MTTKKVGPSTPERRQSVIRNPWHSSLQLSFLLPKTPSPRSQIGSLAEHGSKTHPLLGAKEFCSLYRRKRSEAAFMRSASCQKPPGNGNCGNRTRVHTGILSLQNNAALGGASTILTCALSHLGIRSCWLGCKHHCVQKSPTWPTEEIYHEAIQQTTALAATCTIEEAGRLKKESR